MRLANPVPDKRMCAWGCECVNNNKKNLWVKVFKGPEEPTLLSNRPTVDTRTQRTFAAVPKDARKIHAVGPKSFPKHTCCRFTLLSPCDPHKTLLDSPPGA